MRRVYIGRLSHRIRQRDIERFFHPYGRIRDILMKDGFAFVEFENTIDAEDAVQHLNGKDLVGDRVHVEFARGRAGFRENRDHRDGRDGRDGRDSRRDLRDSRDGRDGRDGRGNGPRGPYSRSNGASSWDPRGDERGSRSLGNHGDGGRNQMGVSFVEKYGPPRNTEYRVLIENLSSRVSWQNLKDLMRKAGEVTFADAHRRERNMGIVDFASYKDMRNAIATLDGTELQGKRIRVYEDKSKRNQRNGGGGRRNDRSRSRERGRPRLRESVSRSRSRSRSRARSPPVRSPVSARAEKRSRSQSRSRSRSAARSRSPWSQQHKSDETETNNKKRHAVSRSVSRSRSRSISRSRSRTRSTEGSDERRDNARSRSRSKSCSSKSPTGSESPRARINESPIREEKSPSFNVG